MELIYNDRKAYIARKDLARIYNVNVNNMGYYGDTTKFSIPLEKTDTSEFIEKVRKGSVWYDLLYAINWYKNNIDTSKAVRKEKGHIDEQQDIGDEVYQKDENITISNMKTAKDLESALREKELRIKEEIANSVRRGELIGIDDFDRASANLLTNMLVAMTNIIEELPSEISTAFRVVDKEAIKKVISINFKHTMDDLKDKLESYE